MPADFLVEIGTEELPPKALKKLSESFDSGIRDGLSAIGLNYSATKAYATPRRLAVLVSSLDEKQQDQHIEKLGPAVQAAFDKEGKPTKAAEGFARSNNTGVDQLEQLETDKGLRLAFRTVQPGKTAREELPAIIEAALNSLPIPKRMRWGNKKVAFVRPIHWIVMLFGNTVVKGSIYGIASSNNTYGHRFHHPEAISLNSPDDYEQALKQAYVIADFKQRSDLIQQKVTEEGNTLGGKAVITEGLLEEVCALVEWPVALAGRFEKRFLQVPAEALISSMKEHQKYFHVVDANGQLLPNFITVANIESKDPAQVINGNERVIRPRLADAAFFFETDKKSTLEEKCPKLKNVVFQKELGSVYDKTLRVAKLAADIAQQIGGNEEYARRAALLCKADLVTEMVYEFADLQGIMASHYARFDGETEEIALALNEQYLPRFSGDQLPGTLTGCALAIADRIDTLVGIFGIGEPPTGNKDPFALRRASLGILNIIVKKQLDLDLRQLLESAQRNYSSLPVPDGLVDQVLKYIIERFKAWYSNENIATEVFLAVNAKQISWALDFDKRIHAVHAFTQLADASALAAANKRVANILAKQDSSPSNTIDNKLLLEAEEKDLATALSKLAADNAPLIANKDYEQVLSNLASIRPCVDAFFDQVMVMADDEALRNNRLVLLQQLQGLFSEVADISLLASNK